MKRKSAPALAHPTAASPAVQALNAERMFDSEMRQGITGAQILVHRLLNVVDRLNSSPAERIAAVDAVQKYLANDSGPTVGEITAGSHVRREAELANLVDPLNRARLGVSTAQTKLELINAAIYFDGLMHRYDSAAKYHTPTGERVRQALALLPISEPPGTVPPGVAFYNRLCEVFHELNDCVMKTSLVRGPDGVTNPSRERASAVSRISEAIDSGTDSLTALHAAALVAAPAGVRETLNLKGNAAIEAARDALGHAVHSPTGGSTTFIKACESLNDARLALVPVVRATPLTPDKDIVWVSSMVATKLVGCSAKNLVQRAEREGWEVKRVGKGRRCRLHYNLDNLEAAWPGVADRYHKREEKRAR